MACLVTASLKRTRDARCDYRRVGVARARVDEHLNAAGRRGAFQRHAPAATTEVVLEAGHCPHDEVPDQVNSALLEWLGGLSPAPGLSPEGAVAPLADAREPAAGEGRTAA